MTITSDSRPVLGPQVAAGRDATIHAVGTDRVLRRIRDGRPVQLEAEIMTHVRRAGFPVPRVHRVGRGELELDRIPGPTMLADLLHHPWRLAGTRGCWPTSTTACTGSPPRRGCGPARYRATPSSISTCILVT